MRLVKEESSSRWWLIPLPALWLAQTLGQRTRGASSSLENEVHISGLCKQILDFFLNCCECVFIKYVGAFAVKSSLNTSRKRWGGDGFAVFKLAESLLNLCLSRCSATNWILQPGSLSSPSTNTAWLFILTESLASVFWPRECLGGRTLNRPDIKHSVTQFNLENDQVPSVNNSTWIINETSRSLPASN